MPARYELPSQEFIARFRARVPRKIAETFTNEQLRALEGAFGSRTVTRHALRLALTVPLPWRRYYLVLLAGRDRRFSNPEGAAALARVAQHHSG